MTSENETEKAQTETPLLLSEMEETSMPKNPLKVGEKYIPPYKMNKIIADIRAKNDTKSEEYQKIMWIYFPNQ